MNIEIIGGDPATQKAVQAKLAEKGFTAETTSGAAELVWKTWHHVPFDNAAMTSAVVALHRDPLIAAAPTMVVALRSILVNLALAEKEGRELGGYGQNAINAARAAIARATEGSAE